MILNGSQIFVEVLVEQGVDTLFGYPGGAVLNLYDELYRNQDRIHHIMTAHEQGASHAADGYARATGKTGVVLATSGPGATNLVTGIATAYMDNVPMVAFTGNVGTAVLGRDAFQEAYIEGITMPITKHNYTVRRVEDLADTMREAFRIAQSGRKGPVLVDIPKDITAASCEFTPQKPAEIPVNTEVDAEDLARAAELINQATRPVVYFGGGVAVSEASCQALRDLIAKADMPATYTLMAAGVLNYGDRRNLGLIGMHGTYTANKAVDQADLVLAVGARFSDRVALNPEKFAAGAKIVQIDIDASEVDKNVLVDASVVGDAAVVLQALLPLVNAADHPDWVYPDRGVAGGRLSAEGQRDGPEAASDHPRDLRDDRAGYDLRHRCRSASDVGGTVRASHEATRLPDEWWSRHHGLRLRCGDRCAGGARKRASCDPLHG